MIITTPIIIGLIIVALSLISWMFWMWGNFSPSEAQNKTKNRTTAKKKEKQSEFKDDIEKSNKKKQMQLFGDCPECGSINVPLDPKTKICLNCMGKYERIRERVEKKSDKTKKSENPF